MREVSRDCFVSYQGKKYSVPFRYAGQKVKIKITLDREIEIYDEQECMAKHPILTGKAQMIAKKEHNEELQNKEKGQEKKNHNGLATHDSPPAPEVEIRPLAAYAVLEEGDPV
ncbi:Mu transposase domain-containing protein [Pseudobacillus badius]|uniref:Mu transposase domain-containing protein n=1 Tax=Bacillus badius TaxID=1455 RepID=UPI000AA06CD7